MNVSTSLLSRVSQMIHGRSYMSLRIRPKVVSLKPGLLPACTGNARFTVRARSKSVAQRTSNMNQTHCEEVCKRYGQAPLAVETYSTHCWSTDTLRNIRHASSGVSQRIWTGESFGKSAEPLVRLGETKGSKH